MTMLWEKGAAYLGVAFGALLGFLVTGIDANAPLLPSVAICSAVTVAMGQMSISIYLISDTKIMVRLKQSRYIRPMIKMHRCVVWCGFATMVVAIAGMNGAADWIGYKEAFYGALFATFFATIRAAQYQVNVATLDAKVMERERWPDGADDDDEFNKKFKRGRGE